ncbi:MAG: hypothetical protein RMY34_29900 [Aulosira sp. DedQUE10]|nr:hypothetical protein [Aulosira sp. DedQUE10]
MAKITNQMKMTQKLINIGFLTFDFRVAALGPISHYQRVNA